MDPERTSPSVGAAGQLTDTRARSSLDWVSWARIVAAAAVVTIHVTSHLVFAWGDVAGRLWHFGNLLQSASRWCVPVFVMVSGALLLRTRPGDTTIDFFRRRAARIAIPLVAWTTFFLWFDAANRGKPLSAYHFVQGFLWGRPYYHLYFLYVVAGLYLITPFLRVLVAHASRRLLVAAVVVTLGLAAADRLQHWWMGGGGFNAFSYFLPWIGYYLLGYLLATIPVRRAHAAWAAAAWVLAVGVTHIGTWWMFAELGPQRGRLLYENFAPTTIVAAGAVVLFLRAVMSERAGSVWPRRCADLTFGVYLLHPIPLELFVRRDQPVFTSAYVDMAFHLGVIVALVVGCAVVTLGLRAVPGLRRLVGG